MQDLLMRQLIRHLRLEWRKHVNAYLAGGETAFRSWEYHLSGCGLVIKAIRKRPSEFFQKLHTGVDRKSSGAAKRRNTILRSALTKMIEADLLQCTGLPGYQPEDKWHHYLYEPGAKPENCIGQGGFDQFLNLRVRLLPPLSVHEELRKRVAGRRKGRKNQQAKRNSSTEETR